MFISDLAIRRPVVTIVSVVTLVLFGLVSLVLLQTDEFPDVAPPIVVVSLPYPGASPDTVERDVTDPVEEAIAGISGVRKVSSNSLDSYAVVVVQFSYDKDMGEATQEIRDQISAVRGDLPADMEEPALTRVNPGDMPIVSLSLASKTMTVGQLTLLADPGISRRLRGLSGVGSVDIVGANTREMTVDLKPDALAAANVSVGEVVAALQAQNLSVPVGRVLGQHDERNIRLGGRVTTPDDFANIVIAERSGRMVRLGDLAFVHAGVEEPRSAARFSGEEAVGINVRKSKGYSTTTVADAVRAEVATIQATLPDGVELRLVRDAGVRVSNSVASVQRALFEGALLTVLTVFVFLNSWRSTVITGLALPVSVLASFIAVLAFGFTLNIMSLLGLSLAIGILIDDAIVVRENIVRHIELGKDHYTASRDGTSEIGLAVAATTFSIVVVFVPIAFMGGEAQEWFAPFALTIACSVLVSLFVSFSLDPMLSAYWPEPHVPMARRSWLSRALARFNDWFNAQADRYKRVIAWALRHRLAMTFIAVAAFVGALAMPMLGLLGGGFVPMQDISEFVVNVETPPGSNLVYTTRKAEEIAAIARTLPGVSHTYTTIGGDTGAVDEGQVYVSLAPKARRSRSQQQIEGELRRRLVAIGGITASVTSGRFDNQKQIQIQVRGPDLQELHRIADQVLVAVRAVPGAIDVGLTTRGQRPELDVRVDRALAGSLGVSVADVAQAIRPAFAGVDAGDWMDPTGKTRDVTVRLSPESRRNAADLATLPIVVRDGQGRPVTLPLGQVATIKSAQGPARIEHLDRQRLITVGANIVDRPPTEVIAGIDRAMRSISLPPGYAITQGGDAEDTREIFSRVGLALGVAVMLMYLVLVVQFGSFLDPLAIMLSLPLSLIGVVGMLMLTGDTLNIMSLIGVILLMGIVAKNAILLIDFAKWSEDKGVPRHEALVEAGRARLRPIMMTTLALIAGMVPVALGHGEGGDFRAPLGRAVIGGVITSTLLTLLVVPTFYDILASVRDAVRGTRRRPVSPPVVAPPPRAVTATAPSPTPIAARPAVPAAAAASTAIAAAPAARTVAPWHAPLAPHAPAKPAPVPAPAPRPAQAPSPTATTPSPAVVRPATTPAPPATGLATRPTPPPPPPAPAAPPRAITALLEAARAAERRR
ncbi:MAG TPA: efflux RND transporter permease subunit [Vicinamibacterales bacterium]|nr:efflux RND transporter permease subunit [Vicinamibacterales bacterium]